MAVNSRINRIESLLQNVISLIIINKIRDKKLQWISIVRVEASKDLSYAKVFFSTITEQKNIKNISKILNNKASKFIKKEMAISKLNLKNIPMLHFIYDNSIQYSEKINKLINMTKNSC